MVRHGIAYMILWSWSMNGLQTRRIPLVRTSGPTPLTNTSWKQASDGALLNGRLESRGQEAFETAVDNARLALDEADLTTAKQEIHEALRDLSRRPDPDLTGAVQHAMAALECTLVRLQTTRERRLGRY